VETCLPSPARGSRLLASCRSSTSPPSLSPSAPCIPEISCAPPRRQACSFIDKLLVFSTTSGEGAQKNRGSRKSFPGGWAPHRDCSGQTQTTPFKEFLLLLLRRGKPQVLPRTYLALVPEIFPFPVPRASVVISCLFRGFSRPPRDKNAPTVFAVGRSPSLLFELGSFPTTSTPSQPLPYSFHHLFPQVIPCLFRTFAGQPTSALRTRTKYFPRKVPLTRRSA